MKNKGMTIIQVLAIICVIVVIIIIVCLFTIKPETIKTDVIKYTLRQNENKITPGDELKIAEEEFYIVSSNEKETILLTKYNLKADINAQATSEYTITSFSNTNYWDENGLKSSYSKQYCKNESDSNCAYVYDSNSNLYNIINSYIKMISSLLNTNINGKLLSLEEAYALKESGEYGKIALTATSYSSYWLGTPYDEINVWAVNSKGEIYYTNINDNILIRPIIVINTSLL